MPDHRRGRPMNRGTRSVAGTYFDLACEMVGVSQEEVARQANVAPSTLSRAFSGQTLVERKKILEWGDILLTFCPAENRALLSAMEAEMLHTLGYATRQEEQQGIDRLAYYQEKVSQVLATKQDRPHAES